MTYEGTKASWHGQGISTYRPDITFVCCVVFSVWILESFIFRLSDRFTVFVLDIIRIALFAGLEISAIVLGFYSHEALLNKKESATDRIKTWMVTEVEITYALEEHILHCF